MKFLPRYYKITLASLAAVQLSTVLYFQLNLVGRTCNSIDFLFFILAILVHCFVPPNSLNQDLTEPYWGMGFYGDIIVSLLYFLVMAIVIRKLAEKFMLSNSSLIYLLSFGIPILINLIALKGANWSVFAI